jgi:hypothetical protein
MGMESAPNSRTLRGNKWTKLKVNVFLGVLHCLTTTHNLPPATLVYCLFIYLVLPSSVFSFCFYA